MPVQLARHQAEGDLRHGLQPAHVEPAVRPETTAATSSSEARVTSTGVGTGAGGTPSTVTSVPEATCSSWPTASSRST
ncbi:hypothetical protein [Serinicoccus chungangensis]|uniref:hypothetical protein n=1 Tax=Serinicoccus chungangensis TaxID=767452 RepID=UPI001476E5ED|nr:hypothetical protein [Serinicoccus chungangensis]